MKKLFQIVQERNEKRLNNEIQSLLKLENTAESGFDVVKIQLAESVLYVVGNVEHSNFK